MTTSITDLKQENIIVQMSTKGTVFTPGYSEHIDQNQFRKDLYADRNRA